MMNKNNIPSFIYKVFQQSKQGLVVTTGDLKIVVANSTFSSITNYDSGRDGVDLLLFLKNHICCESIDQEIWDEVITEGLWDGNVWMGQEEGQLAPYWLHIQAIEGIKEETFYLFTFTDRNLSPEEKEKVNFLAYNDTLTKLSNRVSFEEKTIKLLQQLQASTQMGAMLFIDLDRFKLINDTFGHTCGDILLKAAADRLKSCLGKEDIVGRVGGDELVCFLPYLEKEQDAVNIVKRILMEFSLPFQLRENDVHVTASIGISFYPHDGDSVDTLLTQADTAMYRAKKNGRNNYEMSHAELHASNFERLHLENMLRTAIKEEQFVLYYQPQVNTITKQIDSVEALIRWNHPEYGVVSPAEFMPIAEESGLILEIDDWVIKTACQQAMRWQMNGYKPIRISINLSAQQFMQKNLPDKLERVLQESMLAPHLLEIEITETMVMKDPRMSANQLNKIRAMGVKVAIDDFGTGYSSFQYLIDFPVDCLKIDRLFIKNVDSNRNSKTIMKSMVNLGRDLDLRVVAEGVETSQQLQHLQDPYCDGVQGFYFYKPLSEEQITKLLKTITMETSS